MNPLQRRLIDEIRAGGPMDVATYMTLAMAHRTAGYYATRDPLGSRGDFITAPEISQMFGELVGAALAQAWIDMGAPPRALLVELGPGRGTLMCDALRATRHLPGFHDALRLHLVESSPVLRAAQGRALAASRPVWHEDLSTLPSDAPILLCANEFFDVLPIRQLVRTQQGVQERRIAADDDGRLGFVLDPRTVTLPAGGTFPDSGIVEIAPARDAQMAMVASRIAAQGGCCIVIDYGDLDLDGADTLQAVRDHARAEPLEDPGEADLSSHVAFRPLMEVVRSAGLSAYGPLPQGVWLERLGIAMRFERLARDASCEVRGALQSQLRRLVDGDQMGILFKVMAATSLSEPPAGFTPSECMS